MTNTYKPLIIKLLLYSIIAVGYFLLISEYIRVQDDLIYSLRLDNGLPIESLTDVLYSNNYGYEFQNGRFILHCCTQILCSLDSIIPFCIISTLCFVGLIEGCARLACGHKFGLYIIPLFALIIVLIVPSPGTTLFGLIAFVINYLWTSCAIVWFLVIYYKKYYKPNTLAQILIIIFSVFCGSLQESFSIGLCAGVAVDYLINRNNRNKTKTLMALGFVTGSLVCVLAPGNFLRAQGSGFESSLIRRFILVLGEGWFVWGVLLFSIILLLRHRQKSVEFIKRNCILYTAILSNLAFAVLVAYTFKHQLFSQVMMSLVLAVGLLQSFDIMPSKKIQMIVGITAFSIHLALIYPIYSAREKLAQAYNTLWRKAEQTRKGIVVAKEYTELANSPFVYSFFARYTQLIAANSIIYSKDGIRNLSNYIEKIEGGNLLSTVLPDSIEHIVSSCVSDICSFESYFVVKKHYNDSILAVNLVEKPALFFSKMLSRISNKDYREKKILFSDLQIKFRYKEYEYAIIYKYSDNGYVITDMKAN